MKPSPIWTPTWSTPSAFSFGTTGTSTSSPSRSTVNVTGSPGSLACIVSMTCCCASSSSSSVSRSVSSFSPSTARMMSRTARAPSAGDPGVIAVTSRTDFGS